MTPVAVDQVESLTQAQRDILADIFESYRGAE